MGGTRDNHLQVVGEVDDLLREAAWRPQAWQDICDRLERALPGSAPSILNYDIPAGQVVADFAAGMQPEYVASYREYYAWVNPWMTFWDSVPDGRVNVSERDSPSRLMRGTEFYEDWLLPQGNLEAAVGMRHSIDDNNRIQLAWHYPLSLASRYDEEAAMLLAAIRPHLEMAAQAVTVVGKSSEHAVTLGSMLSQIDGAALLIDGERRIHEANDRAERLLSEGRAVVTSNGLLLLRDAQASRWLEDSVARLVRREPAVPSSFILNLGAAVYQAHVSTAQNYLSPLDRLLVPPRPRVLLVLRLLAGAPLQLDHSSLRAVYGLSAAELRLCDLMANGLSLSDAAAALDVSEGTVRQRVKTVFNKTHTHRQGELVALLGGFGRRN